MASIEAREYRRLGWALSKELDQTHNKPWSRISHISRHVGVSKDTIARNTAILLEMVATTDRKPITGSD